MWTQTQVKHWQGRLSQIKEAKSSSVPGMLTDGQEHSLAAFRSISESDWCLESHILLFDNADRTRGNNEGIQRERRQFNITCTMHGSREVWAKKGGRLANYVVLNLLLLHYGALSFHSAVWLLSVASLIVWGVTVSLISRWNNEILKLHNSTSYLHIVTYRISEIKACRRVKQ